ncbi:MAG TPA: DUF2065 domain-containing protein [Hyphomicrobiales bacterium]|nr:DUF2065 domain-containing protein [Kaistiaceae bacterium]HQF31229.1 DUF2065 domain-containing protein [Hyphomicrobiales bacterium]
MSDFIAAVGLVLVIEGLLYAAMPGRLKRMIAMMLDVPDNTLRYAGLMAATLGLVVVWLVRG